MTESECQLTYSSFRSFVECSGRPASHYVTHDRYVKPIRDNRCCYEREGSALFLCNHCLAFWWECLEHRERAAWDAALLFRDLLNPAHVHQLHEAHSHFD
jgi:hypothetical protein